MQACLGRSSWRLKGLDRAAVLEVGNKNRSASGLGIVLNAVHRIQVRPYPAGDGTLGVVFGDIGTSPLYAIRECFHGEYGIAVTQANVLGVLSLMLWSLLTVVSFKYLTFIFTADNNG